MLLSAGNALRGDAELEMRSRTYAACARAMLAAIQSRLLTM
jgi:hypothetical protein